MLRIFQNIRPISALYVLIVGLLLRLPALLFGEINGANSDLLLVNGIFDFINQNFTVSVLVGLLVIFIQSLLFNRLCIEHDVIYMHSYMPAYFYMLLSSVYPENLLFNPVMLINFAIILCFTFLFQLYRGTDSAKLLYYAALFLGSISVVMPVYYSGLVFLLIGTIIFKNITLKDTLGAISGYAFPAIMVWGIFYLIGMEYGFPKFEYGIKLKFTKNLNSYMAVGVLLLIAVFGLFKSAINYNKNNIKTRRITLLMVAYLAFSVLIILVKLEYFRLFFPVLTISLATPVAYFLLGNKQRRWKEFANYILIASVLYSLYGTHFGGF